MQLHRQDYAIATRHVVRVLPDMTLTALPRTPAFIAGVMNYRGVPVPVIDLAHANTRQGGKAGQDTAGHADTAAAFDTRIILVDHRQATGPLRMLGLRAQHVVGIRTIDPGAIMQTGVHDPHSPFLGRVVADQQPMLQLIDLAHLVPAHVDAWLLDAVDAGAC